MSSRATVVRLIPRKPQERNEEAATPQAACEALYDPLRPIFDDRAWTAKAASVCRRNQRVRRSQVLAVIRRLLVERGFQGVTVRRVAEASGHAVQTIYSLVGPRDQAIVDAIGEYTAFVGRTAAPRVEDPYAVLEILNRWLASIETNPEFCRQVSLIFFTQSRGVFYTFRDRQLAHMRSLLMRQQASGVLQPTIDVRELAEQLVLHASTLCLEWSDRPFPLSQLRGRLRSGYERLLAGAVCPQVA